MILADYFRFPKDAAWDAAVSCGVSCGVVRLPEEEEFDLTNPSHWEKPMLELERYGVKPRIIEPMPNSVHDHIKAGDEKRDESIEKVLQMFPVMKHFGIDTVCFNWMAHVGWFRTRSDFPERGGARVTEFDLAAYEPTHHRITAKELWENYEYFLRAVIPEAEKYEICLALHPDDPPLPQLGDVERIMVNRENIEKAVWGILPSESLGITFCQANYHVMGLDPEELIWAWKEKIRFVHFRNVIGRKDRFHETFHDNGSLPMARLMKAYVVAGVDCPVRVDHVPTLKGEEDAFRGYNAQGRYFAIGYLKGILEAVEGRKE